MDTNPVSRLPQRPTVEREERPYLETGEVARIFRVAADMDRTPHQHAVPYLLPILATFALTGGRAQEVLGLEVSDIDLENRVVHFRPNQHRLLKRPYHRRWVPLWPQLEAILADYPDRFDHRTGLLFPSRKGQMIRDLRGESSERPQAGRHREERDPTHVSTHLRSGPTPNDRPRGGHEPLHCDAGAGTPVPSTHRGTLRAPRKHATP